MGDIKHISQLVYGRKRGQSHDDELVQHPLNNILDRIKSGTSDHWRDKKFENEDDRMESFLDHLERDPDNQS